MKSNCLSLSPYLFRPLSPTPESQLNWKPYLQLPVTRRHWIQIVVSLRQLPVTRQHQVLMRVDLIMWKTLS